MKDLDGGFHQDPSCFMTYIFFVFAESLAE
jgi:hypothetical protein